MKRFIKILAVTLIISIIAASFCLSVSALVIYDGDFGFEVNANKQEAALVSYTGSGTTVVVPSYFGDYSVKVIDNNAFSGNDSIKEVIFSETNTTIEEYAFMGCANLETVYIPENVVNIGDRAFADCTSLKKVTMLSDIVSMPANMFSGCSALSDLTLSKSISDFGYGCFNGCAALTDLDFVSRGVMLDSYAFNGTGAKSVVLSDSLTAIPHYAFTNCPDLKYVTIPESVALIQPDAFDWDNVTIRCTSDSYAHSFALENGVKFEIIPDFLRGDVNLDGKLNILDVTYIQKYRLGYEGCDIDAVQLKRADINGDSEVTLRDATLIQMILARIID
ncbi:MAG: leucine-rich repeat protein [Ruminococcus sp.]|nr:leucine-rich repeat protein [Ruminococcus sp.]